MTLPRRGFLLGMLAAGMAPAIVKSGILMPIKPRLITAVEPDFIRGLGRADVTCDGAAIIEIHGRTREGEPVVERVRMNNGRTYSRRTFWKIDSVRVNRWDDAMVTVRDGLGNKVHTEIAGQHGMRKYMGIQPLDGHIISETTWTTSQTGDPGFEPGVPVLGSIDPRRLILT